MRLFDTLGLSPVFAGPLGERSIVTPTEIQEQVIPLFLKKTPLLFCSPTGTGKTYAYLLPLLTLLLREEGKGPGFLIAAPTFELCSQIKAEADVLLAGTGCKTALLIGQTALKRQIEGLKKERPRVIIGNPGRLLLLARMGKLRLDHVEFIILDEGDRLVSRELFDETRELMDLVKRQRGGEGLLTASCSATFSSKSRERLLPLLAEGTLVLESPGDLLREKIDHWAIYSEDRRKPETLRSLIAALNRGNLASLKGSFKALVFTARIAEVGNIVSRLQFYGAGALGLGGDMKNQARRQVLADFRSGRISILVTSDLAARGLDIPNISHVISLDVPEDPDAYIHRSGRTARAGKRGVMVSIGNENEMRRLAALEKRLGIVVYPKELRGGKLSSPEI